MPVNFTSTDADENSDNTGVAHENVANTDNTDASIIKQGYSYTQPDLTNGLVGYWPLHDDHAQDYTSNGNDGTLNGGVTTGVAGRGGLQAMSFDGTDDYIYINSNIVPSSGFTFTVWANLDTLNSRQDLLNNSDGSNQIGFIIRGDGTVDWFTYDGSSYGFTGASHSLSTNEWTLLTVTWDGSTYRYYENGTEIHSASGSTFVVPSIETWILGYNNSGTLRASPDGTFADVRIYNSALSQPEIQTLYKWGSTDVARPPTDGVARYALDGDATDSWGSNDGTANGGVSFVDDAIRGQAASFDGTDDSIDVPSPGSSEGFVVGAWVKLSTKPSDIAHIFREDGSTSFRLIRYRGDNNDNWEFEVRDTEGNLVDIMSSATPQTGEWTHLLGVKDTSEIRLYVNGQLDSTADASSLGSFEFDSGAIGYNRSGSNDYWYGLIDDVRIYPYALSPSEVHDLYQWGTFGRDLRKYLVTV